MAQQEGTFICVEGIDGAGKSTQVARIKEFFANAGFTDIVVTREPGGTPMAEEIRTLFKKDHAETVSAKTELLLLFAAREQHLNEVIRPAIKRGAIVITDRFVDTTTAYQIAGSDRPDLGQMMNDLEFYVIGADYPERTFVLNIDPIRANERAMARGASDRIEKKGPEYFKRAADAYVELAETYGTYTLVDADMDEDKVFAQITPALEEIASRYRDGNKLTA